MNAILLFTFTALESITLGVICAAAPPPTTRPHAVFFSHKGLSVSDFHPRASYV